MHKFISRESTRRISKRFFFLPFNAGNFLILTLISLLAGLIWLTQAGSSIAQEQSPLQTLWIDLSLGQPLVESFNQNARPDDIARVEHISQLDMLAEVTRGRKLVVFKSAADAERLIPHIYEDIDIVGYNLEHGPANPREEQENPVESIKSLRAVVDKYGLELAFGPDHRFASSHGASMAPYADLFILQIQKVQTEPETVYEFVRPIVNAVRRANPDIEISVQIRTEGEFDDMLALLTPLQDDLDGISILTSVETVPVAQSWLAELRPAPPPTPTPTSTPVKVAEKGTSARASDGLAPFEAAGETAVRANSTPIPDESIAESNAEEEPASANEGPLVPTPDALSAPVENQRAGSTWLFIVIGVAAVIAFGAGYFSRRTDSG